MEIRTRFDSIARWMRRLGVTSATLRIGGSRLKTLCYHGVAPDSAGENEFSVTGRLTSGMLQRQLEWLSRNMTFVELDAVIAAATRGAKLPRRAVLLTFDDAFLNNLTDALPLLKAAGARAVYFIPSDPLNHPGRKLWYARLGIVAGFAESDALVVPGDPASPWPLKNRKDRLAAEARLFRKISSWEAPRRLGFVDELESLNPTRRVPEETDKLFYPHMTWEQLKSIAGDVDIGGHTDTHAALSHVSESEARREVESNFQALRDRLGVAPKAFAYPFGSRDYCGPREENIVKAAGYEVAFTLVPPYRESDANPFALPRRNVAPITLDMFTFLVSGLGNLPMRLRGGE